MPQYQSVTTKRFFFLILMILLLLLSACGSTPTDVLTHPSNASPVAEIDAQATNTALPVPSTETAIPTPVSTSTPVALDFLETLTSLKEKYTASLTPNQWIHVVSQYDDHRNRDYSRQLSSGVYIPSDFVTETWLHLNESSLVDQHVEITKTVDGETMLVQVFVGGMYYSPELSQPNPGEPYSVENFETSGHRLINFLEENYNPDWHTAVRMEMDGQDTIILQTKEIMPEPWPVDNFDKLMSVNFGDTFYDPETGWQRYQNREITFSDGSTAPWYQITYQVELNATLPEEILETLRRQGN